MRFIRTGYDVWNSCTYGNHNRMQPEIEKYFSRFNIYNWPLKEFIFGKICSSKIRPEIWWNPISGSGIYHLNSNITSNRVVFYPNSFLCGKTHKWIRLLDLKFWSIFNGIQLIVLHVLYLSLALGILSSTNEKIWY